MTSRRILFLVTHPPNRGALALETLDEVLVGAAFEQQVSMLFIGDGVYQLLHIDAPLDNAVRGYRALPTYDVKDIYVERSAMQQRGLTRNALALPTVSLTRRGIRALIASHDVVIPD